MKELDVLFERYLDRRYAAAAPPEQRQFERLLDCEDPDLYGWLLGGEPPPGEFRDVVERIRSHD